mmetsp:Transcript_29717/g.94700  ORF Transcript_29717/g.94700 Transcript_29717/m.94700 type:complete len:292 (+) Transcript_29717:1880-2755(+)
MLLLATANAVARCMSAPVRRPRGTVTNAAAIEGAIVAGVLHLALAAPHCRLAARPGTSGSDPAPPRIIAVLICRGGRCGVRTCGANLHRALASSTCHVRAAGAAAVARLPSLRLGTPLAAGVSSRAACCPGNGSPWGSPAAGVVDRSICGARLAIPTAVRAISFTASRASGRTATARLTAAMACLVIAPALHLAVGLAREGPQNLAPGFAACRSSNGCSIILGPGRVLRACSRTANPTAVCQIIAAAALPLWLAAEAGTFREALLHCPSLANHGFHGSPCSSPALPQGCYA